MILAYCSVKSISSMTLKIDRSMSGNQLEHHTLVHNNWCSGSERCASKHNQQKQEKERTRVRKNRLEIPSCGCFRLSCTDTSLQWLKKTQTLWCLSYCTSPSCTVSQQQQTQWERERYEQKTLYTGAFEYCSKASAAYIANTTTHKRKYTAEKKQRS